MKLFIEDDEGLRTVVPLSLDEITIGRREDNTIRLTERNVSRRHARLVRSGGGISIEDLGSYTGVRVNGERIHGLRRLRVGDLVEIGNYDLGVQARQGNTDPPAAPEPAQPADARASEAEVRELAEAEQPRLLGLSGPLRDRPFPLARTRVDVGRTPDNDLVVDHPSVSRRHCRFSLVDGAWKIFDRSSVNGVRVDGAELLVADLRAGSVVELGHLRFRFCPPGEDPKARGALERRARVRTAALAVVALCALAAVVARVQRGPRAARAAEAAMARHDYVRAVELYARSGAPPGQQALAAAEAAGQELWAELSAALAAGDADRASAALARCRGMTSFWCERAQAKVGEVRGLFVRAHLARATAARERGEADACAEEARRVLAEEPAQEQALLLARACGDRAGTR